MHTAVRARPVSPRALLFRSPAVAAVLLLSAALPGCGSGGPGGGSPTDPIEQAQFSISPSTPRLGVGERLALRASGADAPVEWRSLDESIVAIDSSGRITAVAAGRALVEGSAGVSADTIAVVVTPDAVVQTGPQWRIVDDGQVVDVENSILRIRFAYDAAGRDGWFTGGETSGGGGRDGGIVELYYRPTSETRNLVFRNGQWGSLYDQMDLFEAEGASVDRADHDAPDFGSGRDARMLSHRVYESAGRLIAEFEFEFAAWRIRRTYLVYPWGDISVHVRVTQTTGGRFNYLAHRFIFAASRASFTNQETSQSFDWGSNYQHDRELLHAWSDGEPVHEYVEPIRDAVDRNTVLYDAGRQDAYSGFMMDDRNGNDPDIIVFNGDRAIADSPFHRVSSLFGGKQYVESALFSPRWAPANLTHADMTWFYLGTPCCEVRWSDPPLWETSLGSWEESFHVLLRQGLEAADYLPLWRSRAGALAAEAPRRVANGTSRLDARDRLYHIDAEPGAQSLSWEWQRNSASDAAVDYRTAFVVHGFDAAVARIEGDDAPGLTVYQGSGEDELLVVLTGEQPAEPAPYRITLTR